MLRFKAILSVYCNANTRNYTSVRTENNPPVPQLPSPFFIANLISSYLISPRTKVACGANVAANNARVALYVRRLCTPDTLSVFRSSK